VIDCCRTLSVFEAADAEAGAKASVPRTRDFLGIILAWVWESHPIVVLRRLLTAGRAGCNLDGEECIVVIRMRAESSRFEFIYRYWRAIAGLAD
jgi:hypothetical protein